MSSLFPVGGCSGCTQQDCPMPKQWKLNPNLGCDQWTDGVEVEQDELLPFEVEAGFYQEDGVTRFGGEA